MGTTTNYALPYPELSDAPNVPAHMGSLAQAVDTRIKATNDAIAALQAAASSGFQNTLVYKSTTQSIPTAAWTAVTFDVEIIDTGSGWAVGNPSQMVLQQTGQFVVTGFCGFAANATGNRGVGLRVNGTTNYIALSNGDAAGSDEWFGNVHFEGRFNSGDYVELVARQTSGANLSTSSVLPRLSARRVL